MPQWRLGIGRWIFLAGSGALLPASTSWCCSGGGGGFWRGSPRTFPSIRPLLQAYPRRFRAAVKVCSGLSSRPRFRGRISRGAAGDLLHKLEGNRRSKFLWLERLLPCLSCRLGGGTKAWRVAARLHRRWTSQNDGGCAGSCAPEAHLCGVPKQRHVCRCYHGPRRPLHARSRPSLFFLQATMPSRRIFDVGAGSFAGVTPSGFVPGGGAGADAARSPATRGVDEGLDCSCKFLVSVLYFLFFFGSSV